MASFTVTYSYLETGLTTTIYSSAAATAETSLRPLTSFIAHD